jgi:hypothetical protein
MKLSLVISAQPTRYGDVAFAGDLEMVIYSGLGLLFAVVLQRRETSLWAKGLGALGVMLVTAAIISLALLLPAFELYRFSIRSAGYFFKDFYPGPTALLPFYILARWLAPAALFPGARNAALFYQGELVVLFIIMAGRSHPLARRLLWIVPLAGLYMFFMFIPPMNYIMHRLPLLGSMIVPTARCL